MKAFIFPGQGSQHVGMGKDLYDAFSCARDVFHEVDETLKQKLSHLIFEGPEADLTLTQNAQPALMATSIATLAVLKKEAGLCLGETADYVAGHSLGEYSALCAVDAFDLSTTARLLKIRGNAMQDAVPVGEGAMAALLGLDFEAIASLLAEAAQGQVCSIANDNSPGQIVISGHREAVERAIALAQEKGAKRAIMLNVSAPFHCSLMEPAAKAMEIALAEATLGDPLSPILMNVTASPLTAKEDIRPNLVCQVTHTVRWRESIEQLSHLGVDTFVEVGAGKVLTGLVKRISPQAKLYNLSCPQSIENYLKETH